MNYFDFQCVIVRLGLGFDFMELNLCDPRGGYCGLALKVCPFLLLRKKMSMLMGVNHFGNENMELLRMETDGI